MGATRKQAEHEEKCQWMLCANKGKFLDSQGV